MDDHGSARAVAQLAPQPTTNPWDATAARFMQAERETLRALLPGLEESLSAYSLKELEAPDSPAIELYRESGGPGLLIPTQSGGQGIAALSAVRLHRALGATCPSLAIAASMHSLSMTSMVQVARESERGLEWMLIEAIATGNLFVASGFAEGKSGQGAFSPTVHARPVDGGRWHVSGTKKPCSLARSMDLICASCALENDQGIVEKVGVAIISADLPGIVVEPFWASDVLAGAQSESVTLTDVEIENDLVVALSDAGDTSRLESVQAVGMLWFELLVTASYLGMASALAERVLTEARTDATSKAAVACELEATAAALEGVAREFDAGGDVEALLLRSLACRFTAQSSISRATASCVEQLGGMAFIGGSEVSYLASAARALAFHPPSRLRSGDALVKAFRGEGLVIG